VNEFFKIGEYLAKIWTTVLCNVFMADGVYNDYWCRLLKKVQQTAIVAMNSLSQPACIIHILRVNWPKWFKIDQDRLQIDTDLLRIITSTADELSGGINIDDIEPQKLGFKW